MKYCTRCVLPDTRPNLALDPATGVCNACRAHDTRPTIDWAAREQQFQRVVANAKARSQGYDCLIPVSGGKDSTWQVIKCLEYGLNPLTLTWRPPGRTALGQANLDNLRHLGVDHLDYSISPAVEKKFMLAALDRFGSTAIPMHLAIFNMPPRIAVQMHIPLIIWGENSAFEYGSADEADTGFRLDAAWQRRYGVTHGTTAADWVSETLSARELTPYYGVDEAALVRADVLAVFLGYYFPWDVETSRQVARAHGFRENDVARTGYFTYADIDDDFISLHHYLKWYKFGFTRLFDNLSLEIRNGRMTRAAAIDIIRQYGDQTPHADIAKFCDYVGITVADFFARIEKFRNPAIWSYEQGVWRIRDFLIPDWDWTTPHAL